MSKTTQDAFDDTRKALENLRDTIYAEFKLHRIEELLIKVYDFTHSPAPPTHRCYSGTPFYCTHECTIAADPEQREVFHKCVKGGLVHFGGDTGVFYPLDDKVFAHVVTCAEMDERHAKLVFAALGIETPHTHICFSARHCMCEHRCTIAAEPTKQKVFHTCLHGIVFPYPLEFERMEDKQ